MIPGLYWFGCRFIHFARMQCLNVRTLHMDRLKRHDSFIIACTHVSHLEPALLSSMIDRPVHWIARQEYHRNPVIGRAFKWFGSIPIQRTGQPPVKAIRAAIDLARRNRVVGIFPEGGVLRGEQTIYRGGINRLGATVIALHAQVPIVPVMMTGTEKLNMIEPWLPGRHTTVQIAVGPEVIPPPITRTTRRRRRIETGQVLQQRFVDLYQEMRNTFSLTDDNVP